MSNSIPKAAIAVSLVIFSIGVIASPDVWSKRVAEARGANSPSETTPAYASGMNKYHFFRKASPEKPIPGVVNKDAYTRR
ncbi:MAG: hypothetical protein KYX62_11805 [Pseudomonadota bacterium]|nr:hypothetical protein [Pseudomonadota bacterium]